VSNVSSPLPTINKEVARTLTLRRWRNAASDGAGVEDAERGG